MKKKATDIRVYATDEASKKVFERIENIAKRTGLSISKVAGMAIRFGITDVEDRFLEAHELTPKPTKK